MKTWETREEEQEEFLNKTSWGLDRSKRYPEPKTKIEQIFYLDFKDGSVGFKDGFLVAYYKEQFIYESLKFLENPESKKQETFLVF